HAGVVPLPRLGRPVVGDETGVALRRGAARGPFRPAPSPPPLGPRLMRLLGEQLGQLPELVRQYHARGIARLRAVLHPRGADDNRAAMGRPAAPTRPPSSASVGRAAMDPWELFAARGQPRPPRLTVVRNGTSPSTKSFCRLAELGSLWA